MEKQCYTCNHYRAYYMKGYLRFDKTDCGKCKKCETPCKKHDTCDEWQQINLRYQRMLRTSALKRLYDLMLETTAVRQILSEEVDEFKIK